MKLHATWSTVVQLGVMVALAACISLGFGGVAHAQNSADDAAYFVAQINALRVELGLEPLVTDPELRAEANSWTASMAATGELAHSPDISAGVSAPWTLLGENVGVHQIHDLDGLFRAFVESPSHYANLVDPRYTAIGVGVLNTSEGTLWTTHRFMATATEPARDSVLVPVPFPGSVDDSASVLGANPDRRLADLCRQSRGSRQLF